MGRCSSLWLGPSNQLWNDLKTKTVQHYGLGEDYKSYQRCQLSVWTVRNMVKSWRAQAQFWFRPEVTGHEKHQRGQGCWEQHSKNNTIPTVKWWRSHHAVEQCGQGQDWEPGKVLKAEGHMDSTQYQQILKNNVQESVKKLKFFQGWIFQQDNDPKHHQNLLRHSWRTSRMFWNVHPSPQTWISLKICGMIWSWLSTLSDHPTKLNWRCFCRRNGPQYSIEAEEARRSCSFCERRFY